jgi:hypothetical protein
MNESIFGVRRQSEATTALSINLPFQSTADVAGSLIKSI